MYNTQDIANRIKSTVKDKGYSVKKMLNELELGINIISQLSKGQNISCINLAKIADYLDVSVDYLLGRDFEIKKITASSEQTQQVIDLMNQLNYEGQQRVIEQAQLLVMSGNYDKKDNTSQIPSVG